MSGADGTQEDQQNENIQQFGKDVQALLDHRRNIGEIATTSSDADETATRLLELIGPGQVWMALGYLLNDNREELKDILGKAGLSEAQTDQALNIRPEDPDAVKRLQKAVEPVLAHAKLGSNQWRSFGSDTTVSLESAIPLSQVRIETQEGDTLEAVESTWGWLENVRNLLRVVADAHQNAQDARISIPLIYGNQVGDRIVECLSELRRTAEATELDFDKLLNKSDKDE